MMTAEFSPPDQRVFRAVSHFEVDIDEGKRVFMITPEKQKDYSQFLNWNRSPESEMRRIAIPSTSHMMKQTDLHSDY
jgi:hypothetical protein